jgi:hypothetical protein
MIGSPRIAKFSCRTTQSMKSMSGSHCVLFCTADSLTNRAGVLLVARYTLHVFCCMFCLREKSGRYVGVRCGNGLGAFDVGRRPMQQSALRPRMPTSTLSFSPSLPLVYVSRLVLVSVPDPHKQKHTND